LIFFLRDLSTFIGVDEFDVLGEELFVGTLMNVGVFLGINVSITASITSPISSMISGIIIASAIAPVMPVGVKLFLSDLSFLLSDFTGLLDVKSEELFVTDFLDINRFSAKIPVASSITPPVPSVVT
jgi:hypothetical protein